MANFDGYDYSRMSHFIEEFCNLFLDKFFIIEMEENYEMLWQFRNCIVGWTLRVSQYKGYAHLF
jgi:hypothetical protein